MKAGKGINRQLQMHLEDNFEVIHVELVEFTTQAIEKDEEFVWIEDQPSRRTLFRANTMVLMNLAVLFISIFSLWH